MLQALGDTNTRDSLLKGKGSSTVDLLALTSLDQLLLILKIFFTLLQNQVRRSAVLSLSLKLVFLANTISGAG